LGSVGAYIDVATALLELLRAEDAFVDLRVVPLEMLKSQRKHVSHLTCEMLPLSTVTSPQLQYHESLAFLPLVFKPFVKLLVYGNSTDGELLFMTVVGTILPSDCLHFSD